MNFKNISYYDNLLENYKNNKFKQKFISIFLFIFIGKCFYDIIINFHSIYDIIYLFLGLYNGDLVSGLVHIFLDRIVISNNENSSYIRNELNRFAYAFQIHHKYPLNFIDNNYITATYGQGDILIYVFITNLIINNLFNFTNQFNILFNTTILFGAISQITHAYSHKNKKHVPRIIKYLQNTRLILHPNAHSQHHKTFDNNFCIVNGWANPLLQILDKYFIYPLQKQFPTLFL